MNNLLGFFTTEIATTIGWTIVHSLWQGVLIGTMLMITLQIIRRKSASIKYMLGFLALFLFLFISVSTFLYLLPEQTTVHLNNPVINDLSKNVLNRITPGVANYESEMNRFIPFVVFVWFFGIVLFSAKLTGAYIFTMRMRRIGVNLISEEWNKRFSILRYKLKVSKSVRFLQSTYIQIPMVIGYLKPVVLIPVGMFAQIPASQLEAIIAHELAHIKRHDYLIHILQSVIEVLFFYHPFVWWISSVMNEEREHICDDIAVSVCGESLTLAKALTTMETIRHNNSELAMAFNGKKDKLFNRIKRVLSKQGEVSYVNRKVLISAIFILGFILSQFMFNSELRAQNKAQDENLVELKKSVKNQNQYLDLFSIRGNDDYDVKENNNMWSVFPKDTLKKVKEKKNETLILNGEEVEEEKFIQIEDEIKRMIEMTMDRLKDFDSDEWKQRQQEMEAQIKSQLEYLNSEEFTKQLEESQKNIEKQLEYLRSDEYKDKIKQYQKEMETFYNSDEFKKQQEQLAKKSQELAEKYQLMIDTMNWDNYATKWNDYIEKNKPQWEEFIENFEIKFNEQFEQSLGELDLIQEQLFENEEALIQKLEEIEEIKGDLSKEEQEKIVARQEAIAKKQEELARKREYLNQAREKESIERASEMEKRQKEAIVHEKEFKMQEEYLSDVKQELLNDGLIKSADENFKLELNTKEFKINGEIQNRNLLKKYLKIYKKHMGEEPKETHKITFNS